MTTKLSDMQEFFARMHLMELLVQQLLSWELSRLTRSESESCKAEIMEVLRNPSGSGTARHFEVVQRIVELGENFLRRVSLAESDIREGRQDDSPTKQ